MIRFFIDIFFSPEIIKFDLSQDYDGFISVPELKQFMAVTYHNDFTNQQAEQVIRTWDSNRDGRLSTNELAMNSVINPK